MKITSITADGDSEIHKLVEDEFGDSVVMLRDPNHYAIGLAKNLENLGNTFPVLADLGVSESLKTHFLIGMLSHL